MDSSAAATTGGRAIGETPLLEREREIAVFDELLEHRPGASGILLIEGPAGIGKSRLLDVLIERAAEAGVRVLAGGGAHLERDFAFGVVRQLFEPALVDQRERERLLAGAAAPAGAVFETSAPAGAGPGDGSFAALHGLYWLAGALARESATAGARATLPGTICLFTLGVAPDEDSSRAVAATLSAIKRATAPYRAGSYPNFVEEPGAAVSAFYDADTWRRLREVKALYDPRDLFKANHPIPPAEPV